VACLAGIEGAIAGRSREDRCATVTQVLSEVSRLGVEWSVVPMETVYMDSLQLCSQNELIVKGSDKKM